jgi:thermopsin
MGVGDFGLRNVSGTITPYILRTTSVAGTFSTGDVWGTQTTNFEFGTLQAFGMQLNTVMVNTTLFGQGGYYMWLQNVPGYNPTTGALSIENNIWNFSNNPAATFPNTNAILHGSGRISGGVYAASGGTIATVHYPFSLAVYLNTTVGSYLGSLPVNEVYFNYSVWAGNGSLIRSGSYDNVYFNSIARAGYPQRAVPFGSATIQANGLQYSPLGLTDDIEWDWAIGSSSGANANTVYANATLGLIYLNSTTHKWGADPSAWDFGAETGETTMGSYGTWSTSASGQPVEQLRTGPSILTGLWNASAGPGSFALNYKNVAPGNAWIFIAPGPNVGNQSYFNWAPTFGWFTPRGRIGPNIWLQPGLYTVEVMLSGYSMIRQTVDLTIQGQSLSLNLVKNPSSGVFTPDYAFSNQDLANLSTSGAGTASNPYILFGAQGATQSIQPAFGQVNDYFFSIWQGIYVNATTAYAKWAPVPSLLMNFPAWTVSCCITGRFVIPLYNHYQVYLYHTQNLSLVGGTIGGWLENTEQSANYWLYVNTGKNNLIAGVFFNVSSEGADFLGAGAAQNNTIWGNTFSPYSYQSLYSNVGAPSTGLTLAESGDLVFNNAFLTNTSAAASSSSHNTWNVPLQPSSVVSKVANGVPLSGSIIGTAYQGGNYWVDYGRPTNPYGVLPYVERRSSPTGTASIATGGDYVPLSLYGTPQSTTNPAYTAPQYTGLFKVTFSESGLTPSSTFRMFAIHVPVNYPLNGTTFYAPSVSNSSVQTSVTTSALWLPNGTYAFLAGAVTGFAIVPATAASGSVHVAGAAVTGPTIPYRALVTLTLQETGLPTGWTWTVVLNSTYVNTSGSNTVGVKTTVVFSVASGLAYYWTVAATSYVATPSSGVATITTATTVTIAFSAVGARYYLNVTESGLALGATWTLVLNSTGLNLAQSTSGAINSFSGVTAGTYFWSAQATGYTAIPASGMVVVSGNAVAGVAFRANPVVSTYTLSFQQRGYAPSASWTVTVNGASVATVGTYDNFTETNGSYTFTITAAGGWTISPSSGVVTVAGAAVTVGVVFSMASYTLTFTQTGISGGAIWGVTVNGASQISTGTSISYAVGNGTYTYVVNPPSGFAATPSAGVVTVSGASPTPVAITFASAAYTLTFQASGLNVGLTFNITLNGVTKTSVSGSVAFPVTNGTFTYVVAAPHPWTPSPSAGNVVINGASVIVTIAFSSPATYAVTFSESTLPAQAVWAISLNGQTKATNTTSIVFLVINGSYTFSVVPLAGYSATPASGTLAIAGAAVSQPIVFSPPVTYSLVFHETGLAPGTHWNVTIGGVTRASTTTVISFALANGTYSFTIGAISGWSASPSSGRVTVQGGAVTVTVSFSPNLTKTEPALPLLSPSARLEWALPLRV